MPGMATGGWSLTWVTRYSRGGEFVYDPSNILVIKRPNAESQDSWLSDMRISKGFSFGKIDLGVYLDVFNVFNRKFWSGSMRGDESTNYMRSLKLPIDNAAIEEEKGSDKPGDTPSYAALPVFDQWALWRYPRSFAFGLKMDF